MGQPAFIDIKVGCERLLYLLIARSHPQIKIAERDVEAPPIKADMNGWDLSGVIHVSPLAEIDHDYAKEVRLVFASAEDRDLLPQKCNLPQRIKAVNNKLITAPHLRIRLIVNRQPWLLLSSHLQDDIEFFFSHGLDA